MGPAFRSSFKPEATTSLHRAVWLALQIIVGALFFKPLPTLWGMNMAMRNQSLQEFLNAAQTAYLSRASDSNSVRSLNQIFAALETPAPQSNAASGRIPVCHYLDEIAAHTNSFPADLQLTMEKFSAIEPALQWRPRQGDCTGASENFWENHANAIVVGPNGLETREDVWLGVSLVGPNVRYPDHQHPPEETYLVVSPGDFRQERQEWVHVGKGETFYNPPNIVHAMRSSDLPLLVFWALNA